MLSGHVANEKRDLTTYLMLLLSLCLWPMFVDAVDVSGELGGLRVFTSDNPQSNAARSFVVVPNNEEIPEGITKTSTRGNLRKQSPFKIEIVEPVEFDQRVQWVITIPSNDFGRIWVRSDYLGRKQVSEVDTVWKSFLLGHETPERHILIFEPRGQNWAASKSPKIQSAVARKNTGGRTEGSGISFRFPRLKYLVEARIFDADGSLIAKHDTRVEMDDKDMVRQEFINAYRAGDSAARGAGILPVPTREEIQILSNHPDEHTGNGLRENDYSWIIGDGASDLASLLLDAFEGMKHFYRQPGNELKDLDGNPLSIPDSRLRLGSGWRDPQQAEWFSGSRQPGIALDVMPGEMPRNREAAIAYWVLWEAVSSLPDQHKFFAQLEAFTVPLRPSAFRIDIAPRNGIPDAFDQADQLQINLISE